MSCEVKRQRGEGTSACDLEKVFRLKLFENVALEFGEVVGDEDRQEGLSGEEGGGGLRCFPS
jgi:hypothetical protein